MQLFINNWASALTLPATASAVELSVDPAAADLLVGLGSDHYLLTLAVTDEAGAEVAWEIVRVTGKDGGVLDVARAQEGTTALDLAAGTLISARLTADVMASVISQLAGLGGGAHVFSGYGDPNGVVVAPAGSHYVDLDDGDVVWLAGWSDGSSTDWIGLSAEYPAVYIGSSYGWSGDLPKYSYELYFESGAVMSFDTGLEILANFTMDESGPIRSYTVPQKSLVRFQAASSGQLLVTLTPLQSTFAPI